MVASPLGGQRIGEPGETGPMVWVGFFIFGYLPAKAAQIRDIMNLSKKACNRKPIFVTFAPCSASCLQTGWKDSQHG